MNGTLVTWIKTGYPCVKEQSGLPVWILPEHRFARLVDELGDNGILEIARPLASDDRVNLLLGKAPDIEIVSSEAWRAGTANWTPLTYVKDMVEACLETTSQIMGLFNSGRLNADPIMVCRSMVALSFAPFLVDEIPLLIEIAPILRGDAGQPANLLRQYGRTLALGDILTVKQVDECIVRHNQWAEVAAAATKQVTSCRYVPRPIGVTPPMSPEMVAVLADMLKEEPR